MDQLSGYVAPFLQGIAWYFWWRNQGIL